jgi:hypothetical protein
MKSLRNCRRLRTSRAIIILRTGSSSTAARAGPHTGATAARADPPTKGVSDQHGSSDQPDTTSGRLRRTKPTPRQEKTESALDCAAGRRARRPAPSQSRPEDPRIPPRRSASAPRGSAMKQFNGTIADPRGLNRRRSSRMERPRDLADHSGAESRPVDPKQSAFGLAELAEARGDRGGLEVDPEIRADPKLPPSVGPPRAAVVKAGPGGRSAGSTPFNAPQ